MKNRRKGVALELSLITLLVIFGFCLILLTVAELTAKLNKNMTDEVNERAILSMIGDDFVHNCQSGKFAAFSIDNYVKYSSETYAYTRNSEQRYGLSVTDLTKNKVVLVVECDSAGNILRFANCVGSFDPSDDPLPTPTTPTPTPVYIDGITLSYQPVVSGQSYRLVIDLSPEDATETPEVTVKDVQGEPFDGYEDGIVTVGESKAKTLVFTVTSKNVTQTLTTPLVPIEALTLTCDDIVSGGSGQVHAAITPGNATDPIVISCDDDGTVLTVDSHGNFTAAPEIPVGTHTVTFTATSKYGFSSSLEVTVTVEEPTPTEPPVIYITGFELACGDIVDGGEGSVSASITPANATETYEFTCDDPDGIVETMQPDGQFQIVQSIPVGTHTVTFTATSESGVSESITVTVTVEPPPPVYIDSISLSYVAETPGESYRLVITPTPDNATETPSVTVVDEHGNPFDGYENGVITVGSSTAKTLTFTVASQYVTQTLTRPLVPIEELTLSVDPIVNEGEGAVHVSVTPANATDPVTITCDDTEGTVIYMLQSNGQFQVAQIPVGTYNVTFTATSDAGVSESITVTVTIEEPDPTPPDPPAPTLTEIVLGVPEKVCVGGSYTLSCTPVPEDAELPEEIVYSVDETAANFITINPTTGEFSVSKNNVNNHYVPNATFTVTAGDFSDSVEVSLMDAVTVFLGDSKVHYYNDSPIALSAGEGITLTFVVNYPLDYVFRVSDETEDEDKDCIEITDNHNGTYTVRGVHAGSATTIVLYTLLGIDFYPAIYVSVA